MTERKHPPGLTIGLALIAAILGACSSTANCQKPRLYQEAVGGRHIEVPEGLDSLREEREMTIPNASPAAPLPPGDCLDAPPTLRTGSSDDDN